MIRNCKVKNLTQTLGEAQAKAARLISTVLSHLRRFYRAVARGCGKDLPIWRKVYAQNLQQCRLISLICPVRVKHGPL